VSALHLEQHIDGVGPRPPIDDLVVALAQQDQVLGAVALVLAQDDAAAGPLPAGGHDVRHLASDHARLASHAGLAQQLITAGKRAAVAADGVEALDLPFRYRTPGPHRAHPSLGRGRP
jgi:hypothetical protein